MILCQTVTADSVSTVIVSKEPLTQLGQPTKGQKKDDVHKMLRAGVQKFSDGYQKEAADIFAKVVVDDPHNVDALYNLGALAERHRDYQAALQDYEAALSFSPNDKELQQAVLAVQKELSSRHVLVGAAQVDDALIDGATIGSRTTFTVNLNASKKRDQSSLKAQTSFARTAFGTILSVGAGVAPIPEPLHCPLCIWLRKF